MSFPKRPLIENTEEGNRSTENNSSQPTCEKDTKYSWLVCMCGMTLQVLILGVLHAFGVFYVEFISMFNATKSLAAWVGSVAYGLSMTFGPFTSMLVNRYGCRPVMVSGCILCAIAIFGSSFVSSLSQMFGSFSLIYGIGASMSISPTMTIAPEYFDKYMTVAVGLMTAGSSLGTLIMAPLSQALIDAIGWRATFRIYTGACLFSAACACIVRPLSTAPKAPIQKIRMSPARHLMQELKLWKNRVFVVWTLAITCVMFGFYIPYVHLVSYAKDVGIPPEKGSILLMILGACTAIGRIMFGKIVASGILNRLHMHQLSMLVTGTAVMLLPLIKSFTGVILYVVTIGLVDGCYVVLLPVLTVSLMAGENTVTAWGFLVGTSSITFTLGPPVAGALYDALGSYNVAFHCAGIPVIMGGLILFLIPWAQRTSQTNNIMVVVSEQAIAEEYDFADDLLKECPAGSSTENIILERIPFKNPKSKYRKLYKDQSTSTSPESTGYVPRDIDEAVIILRENARLIADMLDSRIVVPVNSTNQGPKSSTKSKSEMVQSAIPGHHPGKVISIMSIPGGLTISQWEPNEGDARAPSYSLNHPVSVQPSQTQISNASSYHSRTLISDPFIDPSLVLLPTPSQLYQASLCRSPESRYNVAGPPKSSSKSSTTPISPFEQTIGNQVDLLKEDLSSPSNDRKIDDENSDHQRAMSSTLRTTLQGSTVNSPPQSSSLNVVSPRSVSTSPALSAIPEVTMPSVNNETSTETAKQSNANQDQALAEEWLDDSPNDPITGVGAINLNISTEGSMSTSPVIQSSISDAIQSNSSGCNRTSQCCSPDREIDVFTHLFNDHDTAL